MNRLRVTFFTTLAMTLAMFAYGQTPAPAGKGSSSQAAATKSKAPPAAAKPSAALVDVNSASLADLKALPGIGDAYAAKIVAGRPYKMKTQLKTRNVIPAAVYEKVKNRIVATQK